MRRPELRHRRIGSPSVSFLEDTQDLRKSGSHSRLLLKHLHVLDPQGFTDLQLHPPNERWQNEVLSDCTRSPQTLPKLQPQNFSHGRPFITQVQVRLSSVQGPSWKHSTKSRRSSGSETLILRKLFFTESTALSLSASSFLKRKTKAPTFLQVILKFLTFKSRKAAKVVLILPSKLV